MKKIKGLYIEDEEDNIKTYSRFFKRQGIEIVALDSLFKNADEYYDYICKNDIDFVIIDNHLDKSAVNYDGFEILKEIRKQDSEIYILLLTNFDYNDKDKYQLGELDQTVNKEQFMNEFIEITSRIQRAYNRRIGINTAEDVKLGIDLKIKKANEELSELKELNESLKRLVSDK